MPIGPTCLLIFLQVPGPGEEGARGDRNAKPKPEVLLLRENEGQDPSGGALETLEAKAHGSSLRAAVMSGKECGGGLGAPGERWQVPFVVGILLRVSGISGYSLPSSPQLPDVTELSGMCWVCGVCWDSN